MHETVKEALKDLYELSTAEKIEDGKGNQISFEDLQSLYLEVVVSAIDLLGMEDIYLKEE